MTLRAVSSVFCELRLHEQTPGGGSRASMAGIPSRCGATRHATLLCWVLAIGKCEGTGYPPPGPSGAAPPSPVAGVPYEDVFSSSWTTECSGTSTTWAEVCGNGLASVVFGTPVGMTSAVVLADLAKVSHSIVDETIELRLKIEDAYYVRGALISAYVGLSSVRCPEKTACAAPMLHGVVSNLTATPHRATLEYKVAAGTAYFGGNLTTALLATQGGPRNAGGGTAISRRISVQIAHDSEVVDAAWNSTGSGNSVQWSELPGGSQLKINRDASTPGSVLVLANLPAVRTGTADVNVEFRIVVNGNPNPDPNPDPDH